MSAASFLTKDVESFKTTFEIFMTISSIVEFQFGYIDHIDNTYVKLPHMRILALSNDKDVLLKVDMNKTNFHHICHKPVKIICNPRIIYDSIKNLNEDHEISLEFNFKYEYINICYRYNSKKGDYFKLLKIINAPISSKQVNFPKFEEFDVVASLNPLEFHDKCQKYDNLININY